MSSPRAAPYSVPLDDELQVDCSAGPKPPSSAHRSPVSRGRGAIFTTDLKVNVE